MRLKPAAAFVLIAIGQGNPRSEAADNEHKRPAIVYLETRRTPVPAMTLRSGIGLASKLFEEIGVHLAWRIGRPTSDDIQSAIVVQFRANTPQSFHSGALAYAEVFEGVHITVFYDRIEDIGDVRLQAKLLGHILAHEVAHILEGMNRHSETGIMKAHWTGEDLVQMSLRHLSFAGSDIRLIHAGLVARRPIPRAF